MMVLSTVLTVALSTGVLPKSLAESSTATCTLEVLVVCSRPAALSQLACPSDASGIDHFDYSVGEACGWAARYFLWGDFPHKKSLKNIIKRYEYEMDGYFSTDFNVNL
jgi:hypothetical protein